VAVSLQAREVQIRVFVAHDRLRETVAYHKALTGGRAAPNFDGSASVTRWKTRIPTPC
jgi:hypothetical protein